MFLPVLHAQPQDRDRQDKIESMHTAYITEKVGLTPVQAQKFWPVYNQFKADQDELQKQRRENARKVKEAGGIDNMSDADVQKLVTNEIDIKSRELDLHKKYVVKFQEVISLKQVAKLFIAEEQFKLYLLEQLKKRRQGRDSEFVPQ
jgi:Spy/CpxP family protein refolding chaperone